MIAIMHRRGSPHRTRSPVHSLILVCVALPLVFFFEGGGARTSPDPSSSTEPALNLSQLVAPETLVKELAARHSKKPVVVCVGFEALYRGAHIPEARYAGPAQQALGLSELKKWAASIPRRMPVVIYCGCCPMSECPNIRPAFGMLRREGFSHVYVLNLPNSFAKDWVEKDYPAERGG